jgi:beta-lactam-binding protein with PASTA domain
VPRLIGEPFDEAVRELASVGLHQTATAYPGTLGNPNFPGRCIKVLSQSPRQGTRVEKGSPVAVVIGAVCGDSVTGGTRG